MKLRVAQAQQPCGRELQQRWSTRQALAWLERTMEKRLPITIVVNLTMVQGQSPNGTELTYTDNVSAHGACVVSSHPWGRGDLADVTSLLDDITVRAKVVHCDKRGEGRYAVGLSFQNGGMFWPICLRYADGNKKQSVSGARSLVGTER
jgi:PilZ domain-containing protein